MSSNFKPKPQCFIPGCAVTNEWNKRLFFKMSFGDLPHWWKTTAWAAKYNTEVPENALICERHFEERFIDRTRKKPRLMAGTIPTMNLCSIEMTDDNDLNNLEYFCRLCAKRGFEKMRYRLEELSEMTDVVQCCLGRYQTVTGLPDGVCETCIGMMKKFSNFVQQCEDSQLQIIQLQTKLKKELEGDRETTTGDHLNVNANKENTDTKEQMESSTRKRKKEFFPRKTMSDCGTQTHARYYHHRRNHNEQLQGFGCQICEKIFTRRDGLRRHLDRM
ncbi:uncharacterized protein LOC134206473 [Armigeres subalbatus]|uniref:uncharacterized protein LOC134206473 n=1 Tax=Armigeres subalbatus TaxID=124917 RepID=UPI002ED55239